MRVRAHPRSRGADTARSVEYTDHPGSSPLARGGLQGNRREFSSRGLIPARAGRTDRPQRRPRRRRAHPRSRGADLDRFPARCWRGGSSPLARGGHPSTPVRPGQEGLIPARAGRTRVSHWSRGQRRAHPRSRGADRRGSSPPSRRSGSSPLARGGRHAPDCPPHVNGLIPARAGRTPRRSTRACGCGAHPRSRGADYEPAGVVHKGEGSSPLARGGQRGKVILSTFTGLIPARAGRTPLARSSPRRCRAHPRSRGADAGVTTRGGGAPGSSPLARGGPLRVGDDEQAKGSSPLARGGPKGCDPHGEVHVAHPRSRGADDDDAYAAVSTKGSSPLARGGHAGRGGLVGCRGLIPARAGRTPSVRPWRP